MYDLIIIGAGAAGIYLGNLTNKLLNVLILEATDEIGGRIKSKKINNKQINLGAEYLHFNNLDNDPFGYIINSLIEDKKDIIPIKGKTWLSYINCDWYDNKKCMDYKERLNILENVVKNNNIKAPINYWEKIIFKRLYYYISNKVERENQLYNADPELIYKVNQLVEKKPLENDSDWYLLNSYQEVIIKIAKKANLNIKFNNIVIEVNYKDNIYYIKSIENNNIIEYKTKYLAITIPLGCLKQNKINFIPELPLEIKSSINKIGYGHHNKVIVSLNDNYISKENYFIIKDSFIHWSNYHKNILIGHILGSEDKTKKEILKEAINDITYLDLKYKNIEIIDWRDYEFAGNGSYSYLEKIEDIKYILNFQKETFDNTLFFAGEAYGIDGFQTVRGAFNSARNVYKKIEKLILNENVNFIDCHHLDNIIYKNNILDKCDSCEEVTEIWECLNCNYKGCGRYKNKCSLNHYNKTEHPLVISYPDRNIWCYKCNSYINYQLKEIDNLYLLTNNKNNWIDNKNKIIDKIVPMETNSNTLDIIEINNKLKIIYKLRE